MESKKGKNKIEAVRNEVREKNEVKKICKQMQKKKNKIETKKCLKNRK